MRPTPPVPPKLAKGELPATAIERTRQARAKLTLDLNRAQSAPHHSIEVSKLIRAQVEALARRGQPDLYRMIEGATEFSIPLLERGIHGRGTVTIPAIGEAPARVVQVPVLVTDYPPDILGLVCFAFGDLLTKRLEAELKLVANDGSALTATDRAAHITDLQAQLLENERQEEELIRLAESSGTEVARRADADPRAVLGVQ